MMIRNVEYILIKTSENKKIFLNVNRKFFKANVITLYDEATMRKLDMIQTTKFELRKKLVLTK